MWSQSWETLRQSWPTLPSMETPIAEQSGREQVPFLPSHLGQSKVAFVIKLLKFFRLKYFFKASRSTSLCWAERSNEEVSLKGWFYFGYFGWRTHRKRWNSFLLSINIERTLKNYHFLEVTSGSEVDYSPDNFEDHEDEEERLGYLKWDHSLQTANIVDLKFK